MLESVFSFIIEVEPLSSLPSVFGCKVDWFSVSVGKVIISELRSNFSVVFILVSDIIFEL